MHASEHATENRRYWNAMAHEWVERGERSWAQADPTWGIWSLPESELRLLPADMTGMAAIELGCGTGYVSAWMARRGARVVGIDVSEEQLATARRLAALHGVELTLVHGNAEQVPRPDASFDFAISEYGAAIWCDPSAWIPEAHRLLRPDGALVFLGHHPLLMTCSSLDGSTPATSRLERDYFGMRRFDWRDAVDEPGGIEFNLPVSEWIRLFHETGFDIAGYQELRAPAPGAETRFSVTADWAHRFPSEQVWHLSKR